MAEEEKNTTLLDYTDPEEFWKDYIRDNAAIVFDSTAQYNFLRENKDTVMRRAKELRYQYTSASEQECVIAACNEVLKLFTENKSLNSLFNKWIVNGGYRLLGLGDTALGRGEYPSFQDIQAENKIVFAEWLADHCRMALKKEASVKTNTHADLADLKSAGLKPDLESQSLDRRTTMAELEFRVIPNQVQFSRFGNTSFPSTIPDKVLDLIITNYSLSTWRLYAYAKDCQEFISELKQRIVVTYSDEITHAHNEIVLTDSRVITKLIRQTLESDTNEPIIVYLKKWITLVGLNYLLWSLDQGDAELLYDVNSDPKLCYTNKRRTTTMIEETKSTDIDELFKLWVAKRYPGDVMNSAAATGALTYRNITDDAKAEFGKWLVDYYGMRSSIRNDDETNSHRCVVVTIEMLVDNRLTNAVLGRLVKDDASHGLGVILNVVVEDKKKRSV